MEGIGVIGIGHVGRSLLNSIPSRMYTKYRFCLYDKYPGALDDIVDKGNSKEEINECNYVFICVPTDLNLATKVLDTSNVEEVFDWCNVKNVCIKCTVPVGFTETMTTLYPNKNIVFSPEYYGETVAHPYGNKGADWVTLGGTLEATKIFANLIQTWVPSTTKIHCVDARTAELAKFMENAFLATKVTFCNTFYDIAQAFGVDYHKLRETWLLDPRMGESHTLVYPENRGYSGKCLPKDIQSIVTQAMEFDIDMEFLNSVIKVNEKFK